MDYRTQINTGTISQSSEHEMHLVRHLARTSQKTVLVTSLKQEVEGCSPNRQFAVGFESRLLLNVQYGIFSPLGVANLFTITKA